MRKRLFMACVLVPLTCTLAGPGRAESPYRLSGSKDGWIAGGSVAAGGISIALSRTPTPLTIREVEQLSRESVPGFDRGATYHYSEEISKASGVLVGVVAAAPVVLLLDTGVRDDWETCGLMYAETMAIAIILPAYGKGTVQRIRPFVYNPDAPMAAKTTSDAKKSFFSRHVCAAFASATFLSTVYGDYHPGSGAKPYVWAGSLLAATA
ncbi:MAG TPA: phosphatase PAP2 family protein, partial [Candidatus Krumholzibacteriaceae bacterium]